MCSSLYHAGDPEAEISVAQVLTLLEAGSEWLLLLFAVGVSALLWFVWWEGDCGDLGL